MLLEKKFKLRSWTLKSSFFFLPITMMTILVAACGGGNSGGNNPTTPTSSKFNDTGIVSYGDLISNNLTSSQNDFPGQDADKGRDFTLKNDQDGHAGFNFTKLGADGKPLAIQNASWDDFGLESNGTHWSCVQDNVTGLIWEIKTSAGDQSKNNSYSWYEPADPSNKIGLETSDGCEGQLKQSKKCNTSAYSSLINNMKLCGANDWRLPTVTELESIVNYGTRAPAIDGNYFFNTTPVFHWTSNTAPIEGTGGISGKNYAMGIGFMDGYSGATLKTSIGAKAVRLVRKP